MSSLGYAVSDTQVLAKRSVLRIRRQPDLLVGFGIIAVFGPLSAWRYRRAVTR